MDRIGSKKSRPLWAAVVLVILVVSAAFVLGSGLVLALDVPALKARVNDYAGLLSPSTITSSKRPFWNLNNRSQRRSWFSP